MTSRDDIVIRHLGLGTRLVLNSGGECSASRNRMRTASIIPLVLILLLLLVLGLQYVTLTWDVATLLNPRPTYVKTGTILTWGTWYDHPWRWIIPAELNCSGKYVCRFTSEISEYSSSHAVMYHGRSETKSIAPLEQRPPHQVWIYFNHESPQETFYYPSSPDVINWTMTYHRSSDYPCMYGSMRSGQYRGGFDPSKNYLEGKNKTVLAVISNCYAASAVARLKYVNTLAKYVDIDVLGSCGKGKCDGCLDRIGDYKFYLAFENAYCTDYITEKFYRNGLSFGAVPVVISGANLSNPAVAVSGSFIDATKYSRAKELADFLKKVGSDPKYYNKYFEWYSNYTISSPSDVQNDALCQVCTALHRGDKLDQSYRSIGEWYKTAGRCYDYPSIS